VLCDFLNKYLSLVGSNLANDLPNCETSPVQYLRGNYPMFELTSVTLEEINSPVK